MAWEFEKIDMGLVSYYLGIQVNQMEEGIVFSQEWYTKELLKKFNMFDCKLVNTLIEFGAKLSKMTGDENKDDSTMFKSFVGSLRYLICTRPNYLICESFHGESY